MCTDKEVKFWKETMPLQDIPTDQKTGRTWKNQTKTKPVIIQEIEADIIRTNNQTKKIIR